MIGCGMGLLIDLGVDLDIIDVISAGYDLLVFEIGVTAFRV